MPIPEHPKIYHITHLGNLPRLVDGFIWSDSERIRQGLNCTVVGMDAIKRRRLEELEVSCHGGTKVGEYTPFYFCFRSIMLYLLYQGNHPDLTYRGGQSPIIHLEADLHAAVEWAQANGRRWAFSKGNAGTRYTPFYADLAELGLLDWDAIAAMNWKETFVRERKQAEFLVERSFPWELIERIGCIDGSAAQSVAAALSTAEHKPVVVVARNWYY